MFKHSPRAIVALALLLFPIVADVQATRYGWPLPKALTSGGEAAGPSRFLLSGPLAAAQASPQLETQAPAFIGADTVPDIIVGQGRGGGLVRVLSGVNGSDLGSGYPFGPGFEGGVRVASADVDGDGVADVIMGQGLGGAQVRIFSGATATEIASFTAFVNFTGGVYVAAGDVNGDGRADLIVGAGAGGGVVRVFSGADRTEIASGYPFGPDFAGGVTVATGDVNSDGQVDYIVGMALGGLVRVFDGATLSLLAGGFPFGPFYFGGVAVAAGDMNGDGRSEIVTASQLDIRPPVRVFDVVAGAMYASFSPHPDSLGVRVAAGDLNSDGFSDLVTGAGLGGLPQVRAFNGRTHAEMLRGVVFDPSFSGGVFVTTTVSGGPNLRFTSPNAATFTAGTANTFTVTTAGAINPSVRLGAGTLPTGVTFTDNGNGTATLAGTPAAGTGGTYALTFRTGFGVGIPQTFTLTVNEAPAITSPNATFMVVNAAASFTVTTIGFPARTLSVSGLLPAGVTFVSNSNSTATLAGIPAAGTAGVYPLTITATNGVGTGATQNFTLTVHNPPTVTSPNTETFVEGAANSFVVTTSAFPAATVITGTGALPSGVTFTNNGDGTATLSGSPATGTAGAYPILISASNGIGSPGTQNFTLNVFPNPVPVFTSAAAATFTVNTGGSFTITTTADPDVTSIVRVGALPAGMTYTDNGNGTATLAGTPALGSDGVYELQFTANNLTATATQDFTLTVNPVVGGTPVITSANGATFVIGAAGTFQVTTTGTPTATTIAATGALPAGITLTNNGDGTATLAGTADPGTAGIYPLIISATNVNATATQDFTLRINNETATPVFTSATSTTFTIGTAGTFAITTAANPDVTAITMIGTPPAGVTFTDNGNGTATLSGTPTAGAGLNSLTFSATNGVGAPVTQNFSLNVLQPAAVTSVAAASFDVTVAGTFTVTTVGTPTPSLTHTGTLPAGVNFTDNGDGTATIAGTAPIGTASPYPITITASNGVGADGTQNFTLNVIGNNPPTIDAIPDPAAIDEDAPLQTVNLTGISAGFNETQTLQVTATSDNTGVVPNPTVTYTSPNATGSLGYTPVAGASGTATITVTVTDAGLNGVIGGGDDGIITETFLVTVNVVSDPPTLDAIPDANIPEDSGAQTVNLSGISAGVGETQDLLVTAVSSNPALIPDPPVTYTSPNTTGSLIYTLAVNASGSADITVTVRDAGPNLALGDFDDQFFAETFTVTVGAVNDPPVAADDGYTVAEGGTLNQAAPGVLANDPDIDGLALSAIVVTPPAHASSFTLNPDGSFTYQHNGSETPATDSFTYRANDTLTDSNIATVTITITPANDPPVVDLDANDSGGTPGVNYAVTFTEGAPALLIEDLEDAGITDADHTELSSLTVRLTNLLDPTFETLSVDLTGFPSFSQTYDTITTPGQGVLTITATPAQPIAAFDAVLQTIRYLNSDENPDTTARVITFVANDGTSDGPAAAATVTIVAVNDPPVADNDSYNVTTGGTLNIAAPGVLDGDTDLEGSSLTAVIETSPQFAASFTLNPDGSFTYVHNGGATGDDSFTYRAFDGTDNSNIATVTIDVNGAPVAVDDANSTTEDAVLGPVAAPGVLGNDTDPDVGDTRTVVGVNGPGNVGVPITTAGGATLTLNADGSYIYDPTAVAAFQQLGAGQSATDTFTYTVEDSGGLQDTATVTITIDGVNDTPTVTTSAGNSSFTEDGLAVIVDAGVTIADVDVVPMAFATVTITNLLNAGDETLALGIAPLGSATANYLAPTLTISGNATRAEYQTMLQAVTYHNASQNPSTTDRTLAFAVNDGTVTSATANKIVTVTAQNDPPALTGAGETLGYTEGDAATAIDATLAVTDVDNANLASATIQISGNYQNGQDVLSFANTATITGVWTPATGTLTLNGSDTLANYEAALENVRYHNTSNNPSELDRTVTWIVSDGTASSTPVQSTITVEAVNSPPLVSNETFQVLGNTELRVDLAAGSTPHTSEATAGATSVAGVLDNDSDPEGDAISVTAIANCSVADPTPPFDCTLTTGEVVHVESNGEFSFTPAPGATSGTLLYTVTDSPATGLPESVVGTVTFTVLERVWYVKNDGAAGNGTSISPLNSLTSLNGAGGAGDPDDADDYVFVYFGDGTATGLNGGLELELRQHLLGQFNGLSIPVALNGNGSPTVLVTPPAATACGGGPCRPLMSHATSNAVTAVSQLPSEIIGFRLQGGSAGNAIEVTTSGDLTANGSLLISQNVFEGAGAEGIEVNENAGTSNTFSLVVVNNTWNAAGAHAGNAIDIVRQAGATGSLVIGINSNTNLLSTGVGGRAINIDGQASTLSFLGFFANNTVHANSTGGVHVANVSFDSSPGGGFDAVNAQALTIGADGDPVTSAGLTLTTVQGLLSFTDLDVFGGTTGLAVSGTGAGMTLNVTPVGSGGTSVIKASNGAGVAVSNATIDLRLSGFASTTGADGVTLTTVAGQFSAPSSATIVKNSGAGSAFAINNSAAGTTALTSSYAGIITNTGTGTSVSVNTADAGSSVTFSGAITDTGGAGIALTANTGASLLFSGGLTLNGTASRFAATNGGTVTVTGTNTVGETTAATQTAVNISGGTIIGGSGVTFRSISATGAATGITVNNTGAGSFTVTGVGSTDGTGGTIQNSTSRGGEFISATNVSLSNMNFTNNGVGGNDLNCGDALGASTNTTFVTSATCESNIHLQSVTGVTLNNVSANDGDAHGINGVAVNGLTMTNVEALRNGDMVGEDGVQLVNLAGTVSVTGSTFRDNASRSFEVQNNSGTPSITFNNDVFGNTNFPTAGGTAPSPSNSTANGALLLATNGTNSASITSVTTNSQFQRIYSIAFFVDMAGNTSQNVTFGQIGSGNSITTASQGVSIVGTNSGGLTALVAGNTINNDETLMDTFASTNINFRRGGGGTPASGNWNATIENNNVGISGNTKSGCEIAGCFGISADDQGSPSGTFTVVIQSNSIFNVSGGIQVGSANAGAHTIRATIMNNNVQEPDTTPQGGSGVSEGNGIFVFSGTSFDGTTYARIEDNNVDGGWAEAINGDAIRIRHQGAAGSQFFVCNISPSPANATQTRDFLIAENPLTSDADGAGAVFDAAGAGFTLGYTASNGCPLLLADNDATDASAGPGPAVTQAEVDQLAAAARERWAAAGLTEAQMAVMQSVTFEVAELPTRYLAELAGDAIRIDPDAGGTGWFVDATPLDDEEFGTPASGAAADGIDLLTAIMHEIGHRLGFRDEHGADARHDLMFDSLRRGERRLPPAAADPVQPVASPQQF